jgi:hypothetical protein
LAVAPQKLHPRTAAAVERGDRDVHAAGRQKGVGLPFFRGTADYMAAPLEVIADQEGGVLRKA